MRKLRELVNGAEGGAAGEGGAEIPGTDPESIKATIEHLVDVMAKDHGLDQDEHRAGVRRRAVAPRHPGPFLSILGHP